MPSNTRSKKVGSNNQNIDDSSTSTDDEQSFHGFQSDDVRSLDWDHTADIVGGSTKALPGSRLNSQATEDDAFMTPAPRNTSSLTEEDNSNGRTTAASGDTVVEAPASRATAHAQLVQDAEAAKDYGEFDDWSPVGLNENALQAHVMEAMEYKKGLAKALTYYTTADPTKVDNVKNLIKFYKELLVKIRAAVDKMVGPRGQGGSGGDGGRGSANTTFTSIDGEMRQERAQRREPAVMDRVLKMLESFDQVHNMGTTSAMDLRLMDQALAAVEGKREALAKDLQLLSDDAIAGGNKELVVKVDKAFDLLQKKSDETAAVVERYKRQHGFGPSERVFASKRVDIKPPTFNGDASGTDYYTFRSAFDEYCQNTGYVTRVDKGLKLRHECLQGEAREATSHLTDLDEIMAYLKTTYGRPSLLFANKAAEIAALGKCPADLLRRQKWLIAVRSKLCKLKHLAEKHSLQHQFDSSGVLGDVQNGLLPEDMRELRLLNRLQGSRGELPGHRWLETVLRHLEDLEAWSSADINLMRLSQRAQEMKISDKPARQQPPATKRVFAVSEEAADVGEVVVGGGGGGGVGAEGGPAVMIAQTVEPKMLECGVCNYRHTHLLYCRKFQSARVKERWQMVCKTGACLRCLRLDAAFPANPEHRQTWFDQHKAVCKSDWVCTLEKCGTVDKCKQNHVTICRHHIKENKARQPEIIKSLDQRLVRADTRFFFAGTPIYSSGGVVGVGGGVETRAASFPQVEEGSGCNILPDIEGPPIYMLQYVPAGVTGEKLLTFYDTGCYAAAISDRAYSLLETVSVRPGPTTLEVAGGAVIRIPHGDEQLKLKLNGTPDTYATVTALRMGEVSSPMPTWPLKEAWSAVMQAYSGTQELPTVEDEIGGASVDIMLGVRYNRYFPKLIFTLPGGLAIYESRLSGCGGHNGVLGGPHPAWAKAMAATRLLTPSAYFTQEMRAYKMEVSTLHHVYSKPAVEMFSDGVSDGEDPGCSECSVFSAVARGLKQFEEVDEIGAGTDYRCVKCRLCGDCKRGETLERTSLVEEREQALIEGCIQLDVANNRVVASLPFIVNPDVALTPNWSVAKAVLDTEMRLMKRDPAMRDDVLRSHAKLVTRGHVVALSDLPAALQRQVAEGGYHIPWRTVYNAGSLSTPCRMVFDASSRTPGGDSLNNVLAKGQNKLATLYTLVMKFRLGHAAMAADVSMAYNSLKLPESEYKYQKYLWIPDLNEANEVETMVITTMIYGVRPAGNLTMAGFDAVAQHVIEHHPNLSTGAEALRDSAYMDDVVAAYMTPMLRDKAALALVETLAVGGMEVKAVTKSGEVPSEKVSADGITVGIMGYRWQPVEDVLGLEVKPLFLGKARRGRIPSLVEGDVSEALRTNFTKRVVAGKVASVFDPLGIVTPFTARLKLDLAEISRLGGGWDDPIPEKYLSTWAENLSDIQELKKILVPRPVIDPGAVGASKLDVIICTDASQTIAVAAAYVRCQVEAGGFRCRLLAAKNKLVSKCSIPRAELKAAVMGAALGHTVTSVLGEMTGQVMFVTDSSVALHWIHQDQRPLQVGVRNSVIEIRRLTQVEQWRHVDSANNPADIATRRGSLEQVEWGQPWQVGYPWMELPWADMPVRTLTELTLSASERMEADSEVRSRAEPGIVLSHRQHTGAVEERYRFSPYLIDPCRWPWRKFRRVLALVLRFAKIWSKKECRSTLRLPEVDKKVVVNLTEDDLKAADTYLFKITTREVKHFTSAQKLKGLGREVNGVLLYTGRLPEVQPIKDVTKVFTDLDALTFVRPIVDRYSPVAYSVMIYAHEVLAHHGGVPPTVRQSLGIVYVISGRDLAIEVKEACVWCRRYRAKLVEVELGRLHETRLTIAPAFYFCQIDLFGPLSARCEHQHRATVKVWGLVFKCPATMAVAVFCLQGYSAQAFTQAYTRFSARYGHPAKVFVDSGSQLLKCCREMEYSVVDLTKSLNARFEVGLEYATCPVGGHNAHGMVERSIRCVRELFKAVFKGLRLDILGYESAFAWIASELNSLPICLGSRTSNLDSTDLITPSRLLLGRNNQRAPAGYAAVSAPGHLIKQMQEVERAWWTVWKDQKICDFVPRPRGLWETTSMTVKVGDIVVFMDNENPLSKPSWTLARVVTANPGVDGQVRAVVVEYRNPQETTFRRTRRYVKTLAVLHSEGDLELIQKLNQAAHSADRHMFMRQFV